jgi:hypothetical protein
MRPIAIPFACVAVLSLSACAGLDLYDPYVDAVTTPVGDSRAIASVSQDAGLSLAAGTSPGTEGGFFYDWRKRDAEQRIQAAQRDERYQRQQQAVAAP